MDTIKQMQLAEQAAFAARQVVLDGLNFDPRRRPIDPDKIADCANTMTFVTIILLAGQLSALKTEGRDDFIHFVLANALAMTQAAQLAGATPEQPSPIITPSSKETAKVLKPNFKKG